MKNELTLSHRYFYRGITAYTNPGYCVYIYNFITNQLIQFDPDVDKVDGVYEIIKSEKMTYTAEAAKDKDVWFCTYRVEVYCIMISLMPDENGIWRKLEKTWESAVKFVTDAPLYLVKRIVRLHFPEDAKRFDDEDYVPFVSKSPKITADYNDIYDARMAQFDFIESEVIPSTYDESVAEELKKDGVKIYKNAVCRNELYFAEIPNNLVMFPDVNPKKINVMYKGRGPKYVIDYESEPGKIVASMKLRPRISINDEVDLSDGMPTVYVRILDGTMVMEEFSEKLTNVATSIVKTRHRLSVKATAILDEHYPFFRDAKAYWDFEDTVAA